MPLNNPIILSVEREWVEAGDISTVLQTLESMEQNDWLMVARNSISFITHGYDDDPRELYDIPEVRGWFQRLFAAYPGLFYWLDMDSNMFVLIGLLLFSPTRVAGNVGLSNEDLQQYMVAGFTGLNQFCDKHGLSAGPTNKMVVRRLIREKV
jgi:hypothetical protein